MTPSAPVEQLGGLADRPPQDLPVDGDQMLDHQPPEGVRRGRRMAGHRGVEVAQLTHGERLFQQAARVRALGVPVPQPGDRAPDDVVMVEGQPVHLGDRALDQRVWSSGEHGLDDPRGQARGARPSFAERIERTRLAPAGPAGLASRLRGGRRVSVDAVRSSDRTIHLTAVASEA
jgi:hypothetical protein